MSPCRKASSINATRKVVDDLEAILKTDPEIERWSFYIGSGAIRFYLPLDQQLANDFFAQAVVVTKDFKVRSGVQQRILAALQRPEFQQVLARVSPLELGPPVGWPLKFRISGPDPTKVRELAHEFASVLGNTPNARNVNFDWNEPSKVVRVEVDQDRARALGISSQALSQTINAVLSGTSVTQLRDSIYLVDIVARAIPEERAKLETLRSLMLDIPGGKSVPLEQVAKLSYALEPPLIWRRQRLPTVTVQADTAPGVEAATVVRSLADQMQQFKAKLPPGYNVIVGGTVEDSAKAAGQRVRRLPAHAAGHDHHPYGAAAELSASVPCARDRATGTHRSCRGAVDLGRADGVRRHPRHRLVGRHGDPQLGDPDRPDRYRNCQWQARLGCGHRRHPASAASNPADRRRRNPRHDPYRTHRFLGTDGLRGDGRIGCGNAAYAGVPARALRGLVPHPTGGSIDGQAREYPSSSGVASRSWCSSPLRGEARVACIEAISLPRSASDAMAAACVPLHKSALKNAFDPLSPLQGVSIMKLNGKVALITGAASGIGHAIAKRYVEADGRVVIADLDPTKAAQAASELGDKKTAIGIRMDVSNEEEVNAGVDQAAAAFGSIDVLVSNAGIQIHGQRRFPEPSPVPSQGLP